jgi:hypothetical protein
MVGMLGVVFCSDVLPLSASARAAADLHWASPKDINQPQGYHTQLM